MKQQEPIKLVGAIMSPYSRKIRSYLRYKRIPYNWITPKLKDGNIIPGLKPPKVPIIPILYFPNDNYTSSYIDSTPLIKKIEKEYSNNSYNHIIIPSKPIISFLCDLIEDYSDEWLTKAMMSYRWSYSDDILKASRLIAFGQDSTQLKQENEHLANKFAERQISRLNTVIGLNERQKHIVEKTFLNTLFFLDQILSEKSFIFGNLPTNADFGIFGQFSQLVLFDPTPSKIVITNYPRITCWTEKLDDLSDLGSRLDIQPDWPNDVNELTISQVKFFRYISQVYIPFLKANYKAYNQSKTTFTCQIEHEEWNQNTFLYQVKCWQQLLDSYAKLSSDDQQKLTELLHIKIDDN